MMRIMYKVPDTMIEDLRIPLGDVYQSVPDLSTRKIIAVGDITTENFLQNGITPWISIVDFKNKRKPLVNRDSVDVYGSGRTITVNNPAGVITEELWMALEGTIKNDEEIQIQVEGEEDLAALPAILLSPGGTTVAYGLPDVGMVVVDVNEKAKNNVKEILKKMEV